MRPEVRGLIDALYPASVSIRDQIRDQDATGGSDTVGDG
jgi:hypothetical protein